MFKLKSSIPRFKLKRKEKYQQIKMIENQMNKQLGEHLLPLSSTKAIQLFSKLLGSYEIQEMTNFNKIYYLGLKAEKILPNSENKNHGFDDENAYYIPIIGDHLAFQYEILDILGSGSFAQVLKCYDHKNKKEIAIKIIKSHISFNNQAQVELKILLFLQKDREKRQDSLFVDVLGHFYFRNHMCIIFELLSFSLYDLLKANSFRGFTISLVRRLSKQILQSLVILKENHIIHCDLKPENIVLLNPNESAIKLIDFGSACFDNEKVYFYIQSRIYRAPEVILGISYTSAIDMWSFGCIIVELFIGSSLFIGENECDQLNAIIEVIGMPPLQLLENGLRAQKFFGPKAKIKNAGTPTGRTRIPGSRKLEEILKTNDSVFLDFIYSNI